MIANIAITTMRTTTEATAMTGLTWRRIPSHICLGNVVLIPPPADSFVGK